MPKKATLAPEPRKVRFSNENALSLTDALRLMSRLSTTYEAQAWGGVGMTSGYAIATIWAHFGSALLSRTELVPLGYTLAVALYTIVTRGSKALQRKLFRANILYTGQVITKKEYDRIRQKALKESGLI